MGPTEVIVLGIVFVGGIGALFWRLTRSQTGTLVLQKFSLALESQERPLPTVEIVGRLQGLLAFALSILGFSPITRFTICGQELCCETSSLFGQRSQFMPLRSVSNLSAGVYKPIGMLIWSVFVIIGGGYVSLSSRSFTPLIIALPISIILLLVYVVTKKFFIELHAQSGQPISLLFRPNVLEGVPIDVEQALEVVRVIREIIVMEGSPMSPRLAPQTRQQAIEVVESVEQVDFELLDENENQARHWYSQATQYSSSGQPRLAIATLQQLIQKFPNTKTAEIARQSLGQRGPQ